MPQMFGVPDMSKEETLISGACEALPEFAEGLEVCDLAASTLPLQCIQVTRFQRCSTWRALHNRT